MDVTRVSNVDGTTFKSFRKTTRVRAVCWRNYRASFIHSIW
ncbi:hypothetical protein L914_19179 [Phytophthora nicotianae]|uniref:Uncharacterized protein n=1 Tax=Phytophthora nicotianae TaxID=4792 RepID=W2MDM0_PHYNI|nr:hypothetical protein L914_19179 [Phytophthora nicotianae]